MVSVSTEKKKNNNELINLRTDARVRENKKSLAGWTVLFVCFDYLVALVSLVTMIVIVFSPPDVIMSVIHGPLRWQGRTRDPER